MGIGGLGGPRSLSFAKIQNVFEMNSHAEVLCSIVTRPRFRALRSFGERQALIP